MLNKIKYKNICILILLVIATSCSHFVSEKNLNLEINKTTKNQLLTEIDYGNDEIFPLKGSYIGKDSYNIIITRNDYIKSDNVHYFYLLKNDILIYYGYPYQFLNNDDQIIRLSGEEAVEILIKKEDIDVKY